MGQSVSTSQGINNNEEKRKMAQSVVDDAIAKNPVMVFSKSYCPYCVKAKKALETVLPRDKYVVMELDQRADCAEIQDYLLELTGARSVPRVFVAGKCIGGGDDTAAMARSGALKKMLEDNKIL